VVKEGGGGEEKSLYWKEVRRGRGIGLEKGPQMMMMMKGSES
jgi:hypothetical protein